MDLADLRRIFARQILALANASDDRPLEDAFALVPRENFLGDGRWRILTPWSPYAYVPSRDAALIYQDVVVALDEERGINNGSPSLHARWLHAVSPRKGEKVVHIGAGTGYYSAVFSELVGQDGRVTAVEYDSERAARAKQNLEDRANVEVVAANGFDFPQSPADVVYVNFALSRPAPAWVENLTIGGRLIFPLGVPSGSTHVGGRHGLNAVVVMATRLDDGYTATALGPVSFVFAEGSTPDRPDDIAALGASLKSGEWERIKSLIWNKVPDNSEACWYAGSDWALSFDEVGR